LLQFRATTRVAPTFHERAINQGASPREGDHEGIDSNKIRKAHQLGSFLGLGSLARLALASGITGLLPWLQGLRRSRSDPGGIDKGHLLFETATRTNHTQLASVLA